MTLGTPSRTRATAILAIGGYANTGISIVQGLVLIPLYLHHIGAHLYGLWLASGGMLGLLGLVNFGINSMMIQRIARAYGEQDIGLAGSYFINGAVVYFCICLLFGMAGWGLSPWLPQMLHAGDEDSHLVRQCFQLAVLAMAMGIFNECLRSFSQALLRPAIPVAGMLAGRTLGIGVTIWMLFNEFGLWAIPVGMLIAEGLIFAVNLLNAISLLYRLGIRLKLAIGIIRDYLRISPVLVMATAGNAVSQQSEPVLIAMLISPEMAATYMVSRRAADIIFQVVSVAYGAAQGAFSHLYGEAGREGLEAAARKAMFYVYGLSLLGFGTYVGMNHAFVELWAGPEFALEPYLTLLVGLGFFVRSIRGMSWLFLKSMGAFVYSSKAIALEAVMKLLLIVILTLLLGVSAVPIAMIAATSMSLAALGKRYMRDSGFRFNEKHLFKVSISIIMIFGGGYLYSLNVDVHGSWLLLAINSLSFASIASLAFLFIHSREISEVAWLGRGR